MRVVLLGLAIVTAGCGRPPADVPLAADPPPAAGPPPARAVPRHGMVVRCFMGEADSGRSASWQTYIAPDFPPSATTKTSGRIGEMGGPTAEIEWAFLGHRGDRDVYRLVRRYPVDDPGCRVQTAEVEFAGERVRVFEDEFHCVVLDPGPPWRPEQPSPPAAR